MFSLFALIVGVLIGWFIPTPAFAGPLFDKIVTYVPALAKFRKGSNL